MRERKRGYVFLSLAIAATFGVTAASGSKTRAGIVQVGQKNQSDSIVGGTYHSPDYGFSVRVPMGLTASTEPVPQPQHGIRITLSKSDEFIWVVANYNAADYASPDDAFKVDLARLREGNNLVRVLRLGTSRLGNLEARRIVISYRDKISRLEMVEDSIVALRNDHDVDVFYQLGLVSLATNYKKNKRVFDEVLGSWRAEKVAH